MEPLTECDDFMALMPEYENWSSGAITVETGRTKAWLHEQMRTAESFGFGEYTIFDGMYSFSLSSHGRMYAMLLKAGE